MKKTLAAMFVLCSVYHLHSITLFAQVTPSIGITKFGSFEGNPDVVNLGNLNVHLGIPIRHKAGRKLDFDYSLSFDSYVWSVQNASWSIAQSRGWTGTNFAASGNNENYSTSYSLLQNCTDANGISQSSPPGSFSGAYVYYTNFAYVDMAGVYHPVPGAITDYNCGSTNQYTYSGFGSAADGSGISAAINSSTYPQNGSAMPVVEFTVPGINNAVFSNWSAYGANEVDSNGNEISFASTASSGSDLSALTNTPLGSFTDTVGQTALTVAENNSYNGSTLVGGSITYSYQNGNGTTSRYSMNYSQHQVVTAFGCSGVSEVSQSEVLPDSLLLPDGRRYQISYEATPGQSIATTGRVSAITFPGGGSVTYAYGPMLCDGTVSSLTRTVYDGLGNSAVWQYSRTLSNGTWTTTVTDPAQNRKVLAFWVGHSGSFYESNRTEYASDGTLLRTIAIDSGSSEPITQKTVMTMLPDATGKTNQIVDTYDYLGSLTQRNVFDFGPVGGGPGPILLQQVNAFDPVNDVFDSLVAQVTVSFNPQGPPLVVQQTSQTDSQALVPTSGLTQHTNTLPSSNRGNPTSVTANGRTITYTYYDTGEVASATDTSTQQTTTYAYNQCNGAYLTVTSQTIPASSVTLTTSASWDCVGGVPTATTDVNGNVTSLQYADPFWRPTNLTDPLGNTVTTTYPTVGSQISTTLTSYAGGLPSRFSETTYDGLYRPILFQTQQAPNASQYSSVAQQYDSRGNVAWTSTPYAAGLGSYSASGPGSWVSYDALGRPSLTQDAGGGTLQYAYSLNDVTVTQGPAASGENAKSRQLEYNGAGMLTSVCEITGAAGSGSCGQSNRASGYLTTYSYTGTLLTAVNQNVQAGSNSPQQRTIGYDSLGRKNTEGIPETGTSQYVYDSDSACQINSPGDLVKTIDNAGNVTCIAYDSLHRPTSSRVISGPYASVTPQTHYVYDTASFSGTPMQNVLGSLAEAYTCFGNCSTKLTDIYLSKTFEASNNHRTGRTISQMWESTPSSGGYFLTQAVTNANGTPAASSASLNGSTIGMPVVTYGLDSVGRTSSVTDATNGITLVSSTSYNPTTGTVTGVSLGNSDSDQFQADPLTGRPTQFQYSIGGPGSFAVTGNLTWNPNGSLHNFSLTDTSDSSKNQNCGYSMDDLNRLASVNCAGSWAQNFSYDPFGNISKGPPSNPGAGQITQSYMAGYNSINNQASSGVSAAYDANGNQTVAEMNTLSWNAASQPVTVNGIGAVYDAVGRLVENNNGGASTQYVYSPGGSKLAVVQSGRMVTGMVALPGGGAAVYGSGGLNFFRHADWLGSSRLATNWDHTVHAKEAYAPFGETYNESGTPDRSFTGQEQDTAIGVYDYLFRRYDPVAGRWLSPDPLGWGAVSQAHPQSLNRYAYVQNNPMSLSDPTGLDCVYFNNNGSVSEILTGDCISDTDSGYFVDGSNAYVTYSQNNIASINFVNDSGSFAIQTTYEQYVFDGSWGGANASVAGGVWDNGTGVSTIGSTPNSIYASNASSNPDPSKQREQQCLNSYYSSRSPLRLAFSMALQQSRTEQRSLVQYQARLYD